MLVFFGCGTAIFTGVDYVATALAFGLTVLVGAYAFGRVSGRPLQPRRVGRGRARRPDGLAPGAGLRRRAARSARWLAGLVLFVLDQGIDGYDIATDGFAQNSFGDQSGIGFAWWAAFLVEVVMTAIFLYVILAVTDARNEHPALAPAAIGLTLAMIHFASINLTGTSVNPARSIGVGLFAGSDAIIQLWLFILGAAGRRCDRGLHLPADLRPRHRAGARLGAGASPGRARPRRCPATARPTSSSRSGTSRPPEQAAWEQEPIIQDGWQWDHAAQEWKPLEQWQPPPRRPSRPARDDRPVGRRRSSSPTRAPAPPQIRPPE